MLIDVKQHAKDTKQSISRAVCDVVSKHIPSWKKQYVGTSTKYFRVLHATKGMSGCAFWNNALKVKKYKPTAHFAMPVAKASTIVLDTERQLLIMDDIIAVDVS